jgi:hypothetical protein
MLNFWSKAGQFITEAITGDKTKDDDFQSLCTKMTTIEEGINSFKTILKGHKLYSEPFCRYLRTLNDCLKQIYNDSPFQSEIQPVIFRHSIILQEMENLGKILAKLFSKTSEWDTIFYKAKELIKVREEKRKVFDHYEQKLLKIEGDQNKKKIKDFLSRNQEKYKVASQEYIDISNKAFDTIQSSIKLSWELSNPILGELIISEKNLFENISSNFNDFGNLNIILKETMEKAYNPELTQGDFFYDPKKFIKSISLNKEENLYEHVFVRKTNTFGEVSNERFLKFDTIKDNFFDKLIEQSQQNQQNQ